jgi:serine/threonine protein kinase
MFGSKKTNKKTNSYLGPPVDVWAMGVMLFCMIAGEFPFRSPAEVMDGK